MANYLSGWLFSKLCDLDVPGIVIYDEQVMNMPATAIMLNKLCDGVYIWNSL